MLRYWISFPPEANVRPDQLDELRHYIREAVDDRAFRDVVVNMGGTITNMRRANPTPAFVQRARAKVR